MIDFAKEAMDLKQALAENTYPAADGTADIDNHALPIIEVTLRDIARRAVEQNASQPEPRHEGEDLCPPQDPSS